MKMKFRGLIAAAVLCTLCVGQASALEYTVDAPEDYLFGTPTSEGTVYEQESNNVDRGKNTALIPPGFGTATSYLPGSGEPLTPNLLPGAMSGGLISSVKTDSSEVSYPTVDSTADRWTGTSFTAVTPNLYYNDDHLGTLSIPSIGLNVKVYQGTDSAALRKGAGHFSETSIWDGNVCLAGHNRGVANHFGKIHTLKTGNIITYTTKLGTRSYTVRSVSKVLYTDTSGTCASDENCLTLYTCVMDQPSYRWMVRAAAQ